MSFQEEENKMKKPIENIKGIVTDVDGTLTSMDRRVNTRAIEALRKVSDSGMKVILATGNVLPIAYAFHRMIGLDGPIIAENGGLLYYKGKIEYLNNIQEAQRAYDFLCKQIRVERLFTDRWRVTEIALEPTVDPDLVRRLLKDFNVNVEFSGFAIHIESRNYTKLSALKKVCDSMGLKLEELAAFGDGMNDIEMLRGCGYGIAVGNAPEEVKKVAKYVTSRSHGDGFVEGLEHLGLI